MIDPSKYNDESDFTLDPSEMRRVRDTRVEWYKAEKDRVDRIALVCFHTVDAAAVSAAKQTNPKITSEEIISVAKAAIENRAKELGVAPEALTPVDLLNPNVLRFRSAVTQYVETDKIKGHVLSRLGMDGVEADKAWKKLKDPTQYFMNLALIYPTTRDGEVIKESLAKGWRLRPWRFAADRFKDFAKIQKGLTQNNLLLAGQDLEVTCKDTQFQKITITAAGPAIWRANAKFQNLVLTKALEMYDKLNFYREVTSEDLLAAMGMASPIANTSNVDAADIDAMLNSM